MVGSSTAEIIHVRRTNPYRRGGELERSFSKSKQLPVVAGQMLFP
jgi:hypothetical protein